MQDTVPTSLGLIAGKGAYPLLLAESAKQHGVERLVAVAFKKETNPRIDALVDESHWLNLGQLSRLLEVFTASQVKHAVMAGQITPTHLFHVRMDTAMLDLLKHLRHRNAETIFGALADKLKTIGVELLPASSFMANHIPSAGLLSAREPSAIERSDISIGIETARVTSGLDIGQTVAIKEGTILAVEAFEGTDAAIRRAGKLGGVGCVIVKIAKKSHDMRFDIPVIGDRTMTTLRKAKAGVLAIEAGRCILLDRVKLIEMADTIGLSLIVVDPGAFGQDSNFGRDG